MLAEDRSASSIPTPGKVRVLHPHVGLATPTSLSSTTEIAQPDAEKLFRLQVLLDLQRERELLYKVVLVIESVAALMVVREWVIWWFA